MKRFLLMLQFLTTIPVPLSIRAQEKDYGEGLVYALPVGLIIGGILAGFNLVFFTLLPPYVRAVLLSILYAVITGGLHLDGLGDTFDGIFSNRPRERILEIMKDSRVGTYGVLAIVFLSLLNTALIYEAQVNLTAMLLLMPVAGRTGMVISAGISKYARSEGGLGKNFIEYCGIKQIILSLVILAAMLLITKEMTILISGFISSLAAIFFTVCFSKKINGVTGDILGAVTELSQTVFMLSCMILQ